MDPTSSSDVDTSNLSAIRMLDIVPFHMSYIIRQKPIGKDDTICKKSTAELLAAYPNKTMYPNGTTVILSPVKGPVKIQKDGGCVSYSVWITYFASDILYLNQD